MNHGQKIRAYNLVHQSGFTMEEIALNYDVSLESLYEYLNAIDLQRSVSEPQDGITQAMVVRIRNLNRVDPNTFSRGELMRQLRLTDQDLDLILPQQAQQPQQPVTPTPQNEG